MVIPLYHCPGRIHFTPAPGTDFAQLREARLDVLGDLVADHLDTAALARLITGGTPRDLPVLPPAGLPQ